MGMGSVPAYGEATVPIYGAQGASAPAGAGPKAELVCLAGEYQGAKIPLEDGKGLVLGTSSTDSQLVLKGTGVSRRHCEVLYNAAAGSFKVTDFSTNGTFDKNGTRLPKGEAVEVRAGDSISLVDDSNVFRLDVIPAADTAYSASSGAAQSSLYTTQVIGSGASSGGYAGGSGYAGPAGYAAYSTPADTAAANQGGSGASSGYEGRTWYDGYASPADAASGGAAGASAGSTYSDGVSASTPAQDPYSGYGTYQDGGAQYQGQSQQYQVAPADPNYASYGAGGGNYGGSGGPSYSHKNRAPALVIVFSIISCGIYAIYWYFVTNKEINELLGHDDVGTGMLAASIFCCPPIMWYIIYKWDKSLLALTEQSRVRYNSNFILWIVLCFLGVGGFVMMFQVQDTLNELNTVRGGAGAY
jgi:pSer/pThr/pTyr-binding forkhead associated (FHA) protein